MNMRESKTVLDAADPVDGYNFAYLDEQTKRMIRRSLLKAVAVPGYQVPFGSREMPLPYGWGTGGIQVTAAIIGRSDTLKVIDQGSDQTTNAVNIRRFFARTAGVPTTTRTVDATIVQTRHRIPETPLSERQILVYQVPMPEPLYRLEPRVAECRKLHALSDYGLISVKLYEDIVRHGSIATTYDYPVMVNDRYLASPSPIPKFDNPKMHMNAALQLFGAGRERRLYAIPPYTKVRSLDFDDHPFEIERWEHACALCGSRDSYLDEMIVDNDGRRMFVCSDSDYCQQQVAAHDRTRVAEADRYLAGRADERAGTHAGGHAAGPSDEHAGEKAGEQAPTTKRETAGDPT
jgi:alpha-D-ribose 1-methylphosphonate 5-phosphate C-P lyase